MVWQPALPQVTQKSEDVSAFAASVALSRASWNSRVYWHTAGTRSVNTLYYGDCLTIMRERMSPDSVDLVYLDPPFNSKRDYNAIYKDETGRALPDQVDAFTDTWTLDAERMKTIREMPALLRGQGVDGHSADFLASFLSGLTQVQPDMAAYLAYMSERLVWMKRVMKPTASIYLHCDPTASHYLKIVMDLVFGRNNFRNEIVWCYRGMPSRAKKWQQKHDVILFYSYSKNLMFNVLRGEATAGSKKTFASARRRGYNANNSKKMVTVFDWGKYRQAVAEGLIPADLQPVEFSGGRPPLRDWWEDIKIIGGPYNKERLGYPTQKPLALLERIIRASSNPGDVVFDPFCGCATTIEAAQKLERRWIGIDITIHAIKRVARRRLQERLHLAQGRDYAIEGVPRTWDGAHELWRQDPYQFQKWCVEQVEGFVNAKRSADDGIDGRIYFDMPGEKILQSMALEVKGGENLSINHLRSLNAALQFENIQMAGLIALKAPGSVQARNFRQQMALAGHVAIGERDYPRLQMLTVDEIFAGARFDMPRPAGRAENRYDSDLFSHSGGP